MITDSVCKENVQECDVCVFGCFGFSSVVVEERKLISEYQFFGGVRRIER